MNRPAILLASLLVVAVLLCLPFAGPVMLQSWLAAWLALSALPVGALAMLMALAATGAEDHPLAGSLRRLLPLMIPSALTAPLLERRALPTLPGAWFAPEALLVREGLVLLAWCLLAVVFFRTSRPSPRPGRRFAGTIGLLLHVALVTLAATDWIASLRPGLVPAGLGLMLLSAQAGAAVSLAILLLPPARRRQHAGPLAGLLMLLLAAWAFLHFTQYLIVWSANLPREAGWYLARTSGTGLAMQALLPAALVLAIPALALRPARALAPCAAALLALHVLGMFWLVTPSLRGRFVVTPLDLAGMLVIAGLAGATLTPAGDRREAPRVPA